MNIKTVISFALFLSLTTTHANELGLTEAQLNSLLKPETTTPLANKKVAHVTKKKATSPIKSASSAALDKQFLARYIEDSIHNIKPVVTKWYAGSMKKGVKNSYPKALKEIESMCDSLSYRASDRSKGKMGSGKLKNLRTRIFKSCSIEVLKAFKQDISSVNASLKRKK